MQHIYKKNTNFILLETLYRCNIVINKIKTTLTKCNWVVVWVLFFSNLFSAQDIVNDNEIDTLTIQGAEAIHIQGGALVFISSNNEEIFYEEKILIDNKVETSISTIEKEKKISLPKDENIEDIKKTKYYHISSSDIPTKLNLTHWHEVFSIPTNSFQQYNLIGENITKYFNIFNNFYHRNIYFHYTDFSVYAYILNFIKLKTNSPPIIYLA